MYGEFTLRETLLYFGWIAGMTTEDVDEKIDFLIRMLQLPNVTRFVKTLSGGQQRRMSLAAALLHGKRIDCSPSLNVRNFFKRNQYSQIIICNIP